MLSNTKALLLALLLALVAFPPSVLGGPVRGVLRDLQEDDKGNNKDNEKGNNKGEDVEEATDQVDLAAASQGILGIVTAQQELTTFVTAATAAGLLESLKADGPFTVFAPTDRAFLKAEIDFLLEPEWLLHLEAVLLYHVAEGTFATSNLRAGDDISSIFEKEPINVTSVDPFIVNGADVLEANIVASNGVVHVIDEVLFPEFTEVTITALAAGIPEQFSTLVELLMAANLTDMLNDDEGAYTVFAPNNDAFQKLDPAILERLATPEGADLLEDILLYHIVQGIAYATGVEVGDTAETLEGSNITVTTTDKDLILNNDTTVISADVLTRNGVIHIIDKVLMPYSEEEMMEEMMMLENGAVNEAPPGGLTLESWAFVGEDYKTLYSLLNITGLTEALTARGPLTLFAPNDDAFNNVPDAEKYLQPEWYAHLYDILLYHMVPGALETASLTEDLDLLTGVGENITVTGEDPWVLNNVSKIVDPDNLVSNGVAHGISEVLLPPSAVYNLLDVAEASPFFEEFVNLLVAAGMEETLSGAGPYTLFAPTNNAIKQMDSATTAVLRSPGGLPRLEDALQYHIVPGIILSDEVKPGDMFETLNGCMLRLSEDKNDFFINDAVILDADILAQNGVIHVINSVLLPSADCETAPPVVPAATDPPAESLMTDPTTEATEPVQPTVEAENSTAPVLPETPNATEPAAVEQPIETEAPEETQPMEVVEDEDDVAANATTNATAAPEEGPAPDAPITEEEDPISSAPMTQVISAVTTLSSILPFLLLA